MVNNFLSLSVNQKEKIAYRTRTSRKYLDEAYLKIFPKEQVDPQPEPAREIVVRPVNEENPVERQNIRTKIYHQDNKGKVLAQQKEYHGKKSLNEKAGIKMLYYLNSHLEYYTKLKPATQPKFNFKQVDGKWP